MQNSSNSQVAVSEMKYKHICCPNYLKFLGANCYNHKTDSCISDFIYLSLLILQIKIQSQRDVA